MTKAQTQPIFKQKHANAVNRRFVSSEKSSSKILENFAKNVAY